MCAAQSLCNHHFYLTRNKTKTNFFFPPIAICYYYPLLYCLMTLKNYRASVALMAILFIGWPDTVLLWFFTTLEKWIIAFVHWILLLVYATRLLLITCCSMIMIGFIWENPWILSPCVWGERAVFLSSMLKPMALPIRHPMPNTKSTHARHGKKGNNENSENHIERSNLFDFQTFFLFATWHVRNGCATLIERNDTNGINQSMLSRWFKAQTSPKVFSLENYGAFFSSFFYHSNPLHFTATTYYIFGTDSDNKENSFHFVLNFEFMQRFSHYPPYQMMWFVVEKITIFVFS